MSQKISIIIPTKNNENTIQQCLRTCCDQSYENIEIIVVDNFSTDKTQDICKKFPNVKLEIFGPERNRQRPHGAEIASGEWLVFIDSDMSLSPYLIQDCIKKTKKNPSVKAFILPEISEGIGFWSRCKILERTCYLHYKPMEGIRMIEKQAYEAVGGWDKSLIAGEDYDLFEKFLQSGFPIGRSNEFIIHNEGRIKLIPFLKKKFYYGRFLTHYLKNAQKRKSTSLARNCFVFRTCYYRHWKKLFRHPLLYIGMFFLIGMTQVAYFLGMNWEKIKKT